ncbi:hypothetical protein, partial [Pseudomonas asplenii]|uniref:hypothetical protein n=1 Tax=Pseudomonas asplenii TaxID=53407 RepID=UPI0019D390B0
CTTRWPGSCWTKSHRATLDSCIAISVVIDEPSRGDYLGAKVAARVFHRVSCRVLAAALGRCSLSRQAAIDQRRPSHESEK